MTWRREGSELHGDGVRAPEPAPRRRTSKSSCAGRRARAARRADRVARSRDRRRCSGSRASSPTAARGAGSARAGGRGGGAIARDSRSRCSRSSSFPRSRSRSGRTAIGDGRDAVARAARRETLRALDSAARAPLWLAGGERSSRHAAACSTRRRAARDERSALRRARADRPLSSIAEVELDLVVRDEENEHAAASSVDGSARCSAIARSTPLSRLASSIAAPARADELALGRRRRDLGVLVLFATAVGALAALWLSGIAARQLARPIGALREAALAIAGGEREPPLDDEPTVEFQSGVHARSGEWPRISTRAAAALEEAQRRTAAVLRNVASGVVAVDPDGRVVARQSARRDAARRPLPPGAPFARIAPAPIAALVERFLSRRDDERASSSWRSTQQQLRGRAHASRARRRGRHARRRHRARARAARARVGRDGAPGRARDQESAHADPARRAASAPRARRQARRLRSRARAERQSDSRRDRSARRDRARVQPLRRGAGRAAARRADRRRGDRARRRGARAHGRDSAIVVGRSRASTSPIDALARADELREVLLNVLENARLAQARRVIVGVERRPTTHERVSDLRARRRPRHSADVLPRIFEPHFSTRTSGSGSGSRSAAARRRLGRRDHGRATPGKGYGHDRGCGADPAEAAPDGTADAEPS